MTFLKKKIIFLINSFQKASGYSFQYCSIKDTSIIAYVKITYENFEKFYKQN